MIEEHKPDAFERRVRFGCGFLFGAIVAISIAFALSLDFSATFWPVISGVAVFSGIITMRCGDSFWLRVARWLSWW